jgi:hypothetical protein
MREHEVRADDHHNYKALVGWDEDVNYWYVVQLRNAPDDEEALMGGHGYTSVSALVRASWGAIDWEMVSERTMHILESEPSIVDMTRHPDQRVAKVMESTLGIRRKAS